MIVRLVVTFTLLAESVGQHVISCSNSTVKAEAGSNITISCKVNPSVDLSAETLDFKRNDVSKTVVHSYRHYKDNHDQQAHQYRHRTALNHADLSRGIVTLSIFSVKQCDKGPYKIFAPGLMAECVFHLDVVERNQQNKIIRNDFNMTEPTEKTVTESDNHGAAEKWKWIGIAIACILAVFALIFLLVKFRKIWKGTLIKKLRRNKGGRKGDHLMTGKEGIKADADNRRELVV